MEQKSPPRGELFASSCPALGHSAQWVCTGGPSHQLDVSAKAANLPLSKAIKAATWCLHSGRKGLCRARNHGCGYGHETPSSVGLGLHSAVPLRDSWSCSRTPFTSRGLPVLQQRRCPWLMPVARGLSVLPAQTVGSDPLTGTGRALGLETCVIHHSLSDAEGFPQAVGKAQTRVFETGPEHTPHRQTKYGFNPA